MLEPVSFTDVTIDDRFWAPRQETNRLVTTWHCLEMLEKAGNIHNFRLAAEGKREGYKGPRYMDSDLYKTLEGIAYVLAKNREPTLQAKMDEIIDLIAAAQMPDGYLNTWHQVTRPESRWTNLRDDHELYCAGHLIEAAVAHQGLLKDGKSKLLEVALSFAEHIWKEFGPDGKPGYPGHPEIELALIKLWKLTGDQRWFDLAQIFIERRGSGYFRKEHGGEMKPPFDENYFVDNLLVDQHWRGVGHAVRFCYLMCAASDICAENRDSELDRMLRRTWQHVRERQMYVTGGVGSNPKTEGFADDFDLPNENGYQETCASIAMAMWGRRLGTKLASPSVFDSIEAILYNAVLGGVGLDGKSFFYENPLESDGSHRRQPWFECACCPPNVLRTIASVGEYAFMKASESLYVNMYLGCGVRTRLGEQELAMDIESSWPSGSRVAITFRSEIKMTLFLRQPSWAHVKVIDLGGSVGNGMLSEMTGCLALQKLWKPEDRIELDLVPNSELVDADLRVTDNLGKAALRFGPFIYCAEQVDNATSLSELKWEEVGELNRRRLSQSDQLSLALSDGSHTFIPYALWANRKPGPMKVWIPR